MIEVTHYPPHTMQKHLVNVGNQRKKPVEKYAIWNADVFAFTLNNSYNQSVWPRAFLANVLYELTSDLLERLSSSCLSATVDLSSSSHISALMRWEFLMMMGTSSNIFSKPMLAFFKLGREGQRQEKRSSHNLSSQSQDLSSITIKCNHFTSSHNRPYERKSHFFYMYSVPLVCINNSVSCIFSYTNFF